ncbi:hypothetical protein HYS48_00630 [Candidatus Woesearchaeota archaeon]|nr:hypothetical protein [Candidatus Woesearchaeota archaeon]
MPWNWFDFRKILIILVIAVLTVVLAHALTLAIYPKPQYDDFCRGYEKAMPLRYPELKEELNCTAQFPEEELNECVEQKGMVQYEYDKQGCPIDWKCDYCQRDFDAANDQYNFILFIVYSIVGVVAIIVSLLLPLQKAEVHSWISYGLMLGGLATIFFGTVTYYSQLGRFVRLAVVIIEFALVVYLAYKKLGKDKAREEGKKKK